MQGAQIARFEYADEAMHHCVEQFNDKDAGNRILQHLRSSIIRIIRYKNTNQNLSEAEALVELNNLLVNVYLNNRRIRCQIGNGGSLLVINIIEGQLDYIWNLSHGEMNEIGIDEIPLLRDAMARLA